MYRFVLILLRDFFLLFFFDFMKNTRKIQLCFAHESGIIINECWILSTLHLAYINAPDVDCHFLTSRNPTLL